VQANFEVIVVMESGTNGLIYPFAFRDLFGKDSGLENVFLSLPEDAQKAILKEEIRSEADLQDCIERYKLKQ
jgi:hypothetical protein